MNTRTAVKVYGDDPITRAGVEAQLRGRPRVAVCDAVDAPDVAVVCVERLDDDGRRQVLTVQRNGCGRVIVVVGDVGEAQLLDVVDLGVGGILRRNEATAERLEESVTIAGRGEASIPSDLLGDLMRQLKETQSSNAPGGFVRRSALTDRETEVIRLIADGQDTREIATELCYSERTIKNVIQDVTRRFGLRNRSHAVAYALRQGLI